MRHQDALWHGLADGTLDVYSSDHSAFFFEGPEGKMRNGRDAPFDKVPYGIPGLELRQPLLFSEGVVKGRLSLEKFVAVSATNPAEIYRLTNKGRIAPGFDADLTLWDPARTQRVSRDILHDGLDYSPYEGIEITGWPVTTLLGGTILVEDGRWRADRATGRLRAADRQPDPGRSIPATGYDVTLDRFVDGFGEG